MLQAPPQIIPAILKKKDKQKTKQKTENELSFCAIWKERYNFYLLSAKKKDLLFIFRFTADNWQ